MSVPIRQDLLVRALCFELCMLLSEVQAALWDKIDAVMLTQFLYQEIIRLAVTIQFKPRSNLPQLTKELRVVRPKLEELAHYFQMFATPEAKMDPAVMMGFHERFTALLEKLDTLQGEEH